MDILLCLLKTKQMTTQMIRSKWAIDPAHSEVRFKIKHLGITNVNGTFAVFQGDVETENDDFDNASVHFEINADSISTKHADRDKHLKSPDLFDTQTFPRITFDGKLQKGGDDYQLSGMLTIRGTTKHIVMDAEFTGTEKGRFNDFRAGFEVNGKINCKDFGLTWNVLTEAGSFVVGEEVKLQFDIQLIRQPD